MRKEARSTASSRTDQQRQSRLQQAMASRRVSLNTLSAQAQEGELKELNLILKSDVQGSLEAILGSVATTASARGSGSGAICRAR